MIFFKAASNSISFIGFTFVFRRKIMKVLVSDNLGEAGIKMFQDEDGLDVDVKTGLSPEELKSIIKDYDALVIRSATKVTEDLLSAATKLKVVGRAGIGLDNVDIPAATKRGVIVMNTPDGNTLYVWFTPDASKPAEAQLTDGVTGIYVFHKVNGTWSAAERVMLQDPGMLALDGCEFVQNNIMYFFENTRIGW